jgi:hypothetical protein
MKLKQILSKLDDYLMKNKWYRWCKEQTLITLINKVRSLKQKLSHDNLFDISLGAILALIGLMLYKNLDVHKLIIIVVPFIFSWFNELIDMWQGAKFRFIEVCLRCLIGTALYFII